MDTGKRKVIGKIYIDDEGRMEIVFDNDQNSDGFVSEHITTKEEYFLSLMKRYAISPELKGYKCIKEAIYYIIEMDHSVSMTKDVYPTVAKRFNTTVPSVERAIRHAITRAYCINTNAFSCDFEEGYGVSKSKLSSPPTNSRFLYTLVNMFELKFK